MTDRRVTNAALLVDWLGYNPGILPTKPPPTSGEAIEFEVDGLPPYKDVHFSIRNPRHKIHDRFVKLRDAAIAATDGRAPYRNAVDLSVTVQCVAFEPGRELLDYVGGIMDSLDGSHGPAFTYLPIIYEDDAQVAAGRFQYLERERASYVISLSFS